MFVYVPLLNNYLFHYSNDDGNVTLTYQPAPTEPSSFKTPTGIKKEKVDKNACRACERTENLDGWAGCDFCSAWYHRQCTQSYAIINSKKSIKNIPFICTECQYLGIKT